jgi:hypothetical protein
MGLGGPQGSICGEAGPVVVAASDSERTATTRGFLMEELLKVNGR